MIPDQYRDTIEQFVAAYYDRRKWELEQAFISTTGLLPVCPAEDILTSALADQLGDIARAASGELAHSDDGWTEGVLQECVQDLMERLFAAPTGILLTTYQISDAFWDTPIGQMVARALLWLRGDELITLSEAAELLGMSLPAVSQAVSSGRLRGYIDPDADGSNKGRRKVARSDVERLRKTGTSRDA
jgi:DNA-binding MarR family transcriptional regulator